MFESRKIRLTSALLLLVLPTVQAFTCPILNPSHPEHANIVALLRLRDSLLYLSIALGVLFISIQGIQWIVADNPQDRANVKKTLQFLLIGLLLLNVIPYIVTNVYCATICSYLIC